MPVTWSHYLIFMCSSTLSFNRRLFYLQCTSPPNKFSQLTLHSVHLSDAMKWRAQCHIFSDGLKFVVCVCVVTLLFTGCMSAKTFLSVSTWVSTGCMCAVAQSNCTKSLRSFPLQIEEYVHILVSNEGIQQAAWNAQNHLAYISTNYCTWPRNSPTHNLWNHNVTVYAFSFCTLQTNNLKYVKKLYCCW